MKFNSIIYGALIAPLLFASSLASPDNFEARALGRGRRPPPGHHTVPAHHSAPAHHTVPKGDHSTKKHVSSHASHSTKKALSSSHSHSASHTTGAKGTHTSTSSAHPTNTHGPTRSMIIYGKSGISDAKFKAAIKKIQPKVTVLFQNTALDIQMAAAPLTAEEIKELKKDKSIGTITENDGASDTESDSGKGSGKGGKQPPSRGKKSKPVRRDMLTQKGAADLALLSQMPGKPAGKDYHYDSTAGDDITVYVMDSGLNPHHSEFSHVNKVRWLFPVEHHTGTTKNDPDGHGTCVAAKAVGSKYGVAKNANLVVVKDSVKTNVAETIAAWGYIFADVSIANMGHRSVVNFSQKLKFKPNAENKRRWAKIISKLIDLGTIVVVAAGNDGVPVDHYPALYSKVLPIIVVGSVEDDGSISKFSDRGPLVTLYAGGTTVCPTKSGNGITYQEGTSFASPTVAGLIAYLLAHPTTKEHFSTLKGSERSTQMKQLLQGLSWERIPGGPKVAYNGINPDTACHRPGAAAGANGKRADSCPAWRAALEDDSLPKAKGSATESGASATKTAASTSGGAETSAPASTSKAGKKHASKTKASTTAAAATATASASASASATATDA